MTVACWVCRGEVEQADAVGLNGKWSHVRCFGRALDKTLAPVKGAIETINLPEKLHPRDAYDLGIDTGVRIQRKRRRR